LDEIHGLLKRQIKKSFGDTSAVPEEYLPFIQLVDGAYREFDADRRMLERSLDLSSSELLQAAAQLKIVHEIALGIESRTKLDDILAFVVESARQLHGIPFVLVQKLDETEQYVITPYYSKIHDDNRSVKLLKKIGFDINVYLGSHSTSNKLRLPLAKLPVAQDYLANPRTIVVERLAELLNSLWPKAMCDAIQEIIGLKQCVTASLLIDGKSWGNLLYFLDDYVPKNILESIAAHCALGIKKSLILESLQEQNNELAALNKIAKQAASTLELDQMLQNILVETISVFDAYSADIFLACANGQELELIAHIGQPENLAVYPGKYKFESGVTEAVITVIDDILIDNIKEFPELFPHYKGYTKKAADQSFAALKIPQKQGLSGIMIVVLKENQTFTHAEKSLLLTICGQVALAIENARLHGNLLLTMKELAQTNINLAGTLKRLTESEEKVRRTIETVTEGIIVTDMDGWILDINDTGLKMCGYSEKRIVINKNVFRLLDGQEHLSILKNAIEQGKIGRVDGVFTRGDGQKFDAELNAAVIRDANGQATELVMSMRDVTEHNRSEAVLRESEEKYRMIFESANDIMMLIDTKGKIIDVNKRLTDIGGYEIEEILGNNITTLTKILTKKSLTTIVANFMRRLAGMHVPVYEVEMYKKNGELAIIEISAVPVRRSGKIIGDLAILRDVGERRRSESRLIEQKALTDRILASSPNAVAVIGQDRHVVMANNSFERIFFSKKEQYEEEDISLIIPVTTVVEAISTAMSSGCSKTGIEFRTLHDKVECTMIADVICMQKNEVLVTIRDITPEIEKTERLYLTDRLASVGEMASGIAHELNNPLTSIIGLSQLLAEEQLPGDIGNDIVSISKEAQRASHIVKNLLTFARRHSSERKLVSIDDIIADVLVLRAYENKVNNIKVVTNFSSNLPQVMVDYFQMQQVFLNLVLNAEQAITQAHGKGEINISAEYTDGIVRISFADDGPGIAPENIKRIFDPFFTTKEVGKGTGLGLSISYGIVSAHGGRIFVGSDYNKGATFIVELPVYITQPEQNKTQWIETIKKEEPLLLDKA
jgi:PAS domain S-box-containing protein